MFSLIENYISLLIRLFGLNLGLLLLLISIIIVAGTFALLLEITLERIKR